MAANKTTKKTKKSSVKKSTTKKSKSTVTKAGAVRSLFDKKKTVTFDAVKKASGYTATKDVHHIMRRLRNRKVPLNTKFDTETRTFSLTK